MEITLVGYIVLALCFFGLTRKKDDFLLYLAVFFSTFTATSAINIPITTTCLSPFHVIVLFWVAKLFYQAYQQKITWKQIKQKVTKNQFMLLLILFSISITISMVLLLFRSNGIEYIGAKGQIKQIQFSAGNITQLGYVLFMTLFSALLILKLETKEQVKTILKIFAISTIFAMVWGLVQFCMAYLKIPYPAFLFNNNTNYSQQFNQRVYGMKRVNSIATEPSMFAINLLAFLPLITMLWLTNTKVVKNKYVSKIIVIGVLLLTLVTMILTTSSTAYVGIALTILLIGGYTLFLSQKGKAVSQNKKKIIWIIVFTVLGLGFVFFLCVKVFHMYYGTLVDTILDMTVNKLHLTSGNIRMETMRVATGIFMGQPLFGVAFGSFRSFDLFTNLIASTGLLGTALYFSMIVISLREVWQARKQKETLSMALFFMLLLSTIGLCISVPDLIYGYHWILIVLAYVYPKLKGDKEVEKKNKVIGIDARTLIEKRTGIGTYTYKIIQYLNEIDQENTYILYSNKEIYLDFPLHENFKIKQYKAKIGTFGVYFKLPRLLQEDQVDVFWGTQHCLPKRNGATKGIRYVVTIHDLALNKFKKIGSTYNTIINRLIVKKSCQKADEIIAVSKATKQDIITLFSIPEEKIKVIYEGAPTQKQYKLTKEQEEQIQEKYGITEQTNFLFFLSTIEPRKNLNTAIKAFLAYQKTHQENLKFIISGGIGWKCEDTLALIQSDPSMIQTGYISKEEKDYFFHYAKAFLYPSLYEGFGIPVLEAMGADCLVITSDVSSLPEVGGEAAFYLKEVKNEKELCHLIEEVITLTEDQKNERIQKGREQVKRFTWEACAKQVHQELVK